MYARPDTYRHGQRGAAAIEFALVAAILLALLFGIIEFGRLFFTINGVQEITRRAAREQVVRWVTAGDEVRRMAVLQAGTTGTVNFPGSPDITNTDVQLRFYNTYADAVAGGAGISGVTSSQNNFNNCLLGNTNCIKYVRATLTQNGAKVPFNPVALFLPTNFGLLPMTQDFFLPYSTVIMPAEALGLL